MKFLVRAGHTLRRVWQQQIESVNKRVRQPKMIYNMGAYFEVAELENCRVEQLSQKNFLQFSLLSNESHLREAVKQIAIPRVVGTPGHAKVREYIVNSLRELQWSVDVHKFHATAPILGKLHFQNIIARLNPHAERYLVLSAHYDSKYFADFDFIGATDSAVPCAMLLNLAHVLNEQLSVFRDSKVSLMLIFFDGEEAFKEWNANDSIYGSRHLAKKWESEGFLERLDMLVLFDLIGTSHPQFYCFYPETEPWYSSFVRNEERLSQAGLLERYTTSGVSRQSNLNQYFQPNSLRSYVEDDHIPFVRRKVPVIHLISMPFPDVWHTEHDNLSIVDYDATENIARVARLFTMEYLLSCNNVK